MEELHWSANDNKPKVELKLLPSNLKYVFMEEGENKPIIISLSMSKE